MLRIERGELLEVTFVRCLLIKRRLAIGSSSDGHNLLNKSIDLCLITYGDSNNLIAL